MKWKFKEWGSFGDCEIIYENKGTNECEVTVTIKNIPDHDAHGSYIHTDSIKDGWRNNLFKRIHQVFGYPLRDN